MDDNWLVRGWTEAGYPARGFIAAVQGRPALAAMAQGTAWLINSYGETGIQVFRLLGMAALGICAVLTYRLTSRLPISQPFRVLAALLWITLPATQVIAANGTWLTVGIASALAALLLLLRPLNILSASATVFLIWLAVATYQPIFFIIPSLYLLTLYDFDPRSRQQLYSVLRRVGLVVGAFVIYYLAWKAAFAVGFPNSSENRYNPNALLALSEWPERIATDFTLRTSMLLDVWGVRDGFENISLYVRSVLVVVALMATLRWMITSRNMWKLLQVSFLFGLAFLVSETPVLLSGRVLWSYTTMISATFVFSIMVCGLLSNAIGKRRFAAPAALSIIFLGAVLASISVTRHFAIPTWLDMKLVRAYAEQRIESGQEGEPLVFCYIGKTHVYRRDSIDPQYGFQEFAWSNMTPFYAYWHTRTVLRLMDFDGDDVIVILKDPMTGKINISPSGAEAECIEGAYLDFAEQTKHDLWRR